MNLDLGWTGVRTRVGVGAVGAVAGGGWVVGGALAWVSNIYFSMWFFIGKVPVAQCIVYARVLRSYSGVLLSILRMSAAMAGRYRCPVLRFSETSVETLRT